MRDDVVCTYLLPSRRMRDAVLRRTKCVTNRRLFDEVAYLRSCSNGSVWSAAALSGLVISASPSSTREEQDEGGNRTRRGRFQLRWYKKSLEQSRECETEIRASRVINRCGLIIEGGGEVEYRWSDGANFREISSISSSANWDNWCGEWRHRQIGYYSLPSAVFVIIIGAQSNQVHGAAASAVSRLGGACLQPWLMLS